MRQGPATVPAFFLVRRSGFVDQSTETNSKPTGAWKRREHPTSQRLANAIWSPPQSLKRDRTYPDKFEGKAPDSRCHDTHPGCFVIGLERVVEIDPTLSADRDFRQCKASL